MRDPLAFLTLAATAVILALLLPFAAHRAWLVYRARSVGSSPPREWRGPLPRVAVQLPIFNEASVVGRLLDAVCRLDYPEHLLEVQVLDDSDDATTELAARRVEFWRSRGVRIRHLRRDSRAGFKAGALAYGLDSTDAEFLVVLDADFVPRADLIRRLLAGFTGPEIGMVQARWDHLNERDNSLTRAQAYLLDGHFLFEQGGRYAAGRFFNFNGTAGMWRRSCLVDAGGWSSDTLTEDLDISYRAQMAGWRFTFLDDYSVPAELPPAVDAFEVQQKRWAQGGIQTARKILPRLLRMDLPRTVKVESAIHLLGHLAHPLTLGLGLLIYPSAVARQRLGLEHLVWLDLLAFVLATGPFLVFYGSVARRRGHTWMEAAPRVALTLATGIGLSVAVTRAVIRGLGRTDDAFVRTPKRGWSPRIRYRVKAAPGDLIPKLVLSGYLVWCIGAAVQTGLYGSLPFLLLFLSGYLFLGLRQLAASASNRTLGSTQPVRVLRTASHRSKAQNGVQITSRTGSGSGHTPVAWNASRPQ